jgi:hypothetical protein
MARLPKKQNRENPAAQSQGSKAGKDRQDGQVAERKSKTRKTWRRKVMGLKSEQQH